MALVTPRIPLPGDDIMVWASQLVDAFPPSDVIPMLDDPKEWRRWAMSFCYRSPTFARFHVPDPYIYETWQGWALSLLLVMPFGS